VGCGISFIPFAKHFIKLTTEVEGEKWINAVDDRGRTILHNAALKGDLVIVKELLANGIDKTIVDKYDFDAYGYAMREDHFKVALQILTHRRQTLQFTKGSGTFGSHLHLAVAKL
jgi:ankyrin repeat protein